METNTIIEETANGSVEVQYSLAKAIVLPPSNIPAYKDLSDGVDGLIKDGKTGADVIEYLKGRF